MEIPTSIKLQALDQFETLLDNEKLSDVQLIVNEKIIYAHKHILACRSTVFNAMFKNPMKEAKENIIKIRDVQYEVMLETLRFIYAGKVNEINKYSKELLATADMYNLDGLKEICARNLSRNITFDNVVEYLHLADLHNVQPMKEEAVKFIVSNGKSVVNQPNFNSIVHLHKDVFLEVVRTVLLKHDAVLSLQEGITVFRSNTLFR